MAVAALVLLAGCGAALQTASDPTREADAGATDRTVSTTGAGSADADADRAVVRVAVTARADTAEAAREAVAADAARMRTALRDAGTDDDAVTTAYYRISPQYANGGERDSRAIVGYDAVHAYRIDAAAAAGTVVDTALGGGASEIQGVTFTLSDETRAELRAVALERAVAAARADAETIASSSELSIVGVQSASTGGRIGIGAAYGPEAADRIGTTFDSGSVTVTATVAVTYVAAA